MLKSKTMWAGIAGLVSAAGGYFTGDLGLAAALQIGLTSVIGIFLKHAVTKAGSGE